ncbi:hypothetical protein EON81_08120 [bacterium]|nr:MAG: hypothetical protein EON81_08120 [bacterium]
MLAAALLLSFRPEPSALDKAVEESTAALNALSKVTCNYSMKSSRGDESEGTVQFEYGKDGINERVVATSKDEVVAKMVHTEGRSITLYPGQKVFWEHILPESEFKLEKPKPVEENSFNVAFLVSRGMTLQLECNPAFRVLSETTEERDGISVRTIHFEAKKETGTGAVKGFAQFDAKEKFFLGTEVEVVGESAGKLVMRRDKFEKIPPPASDFIVEAKEYEGLRKIDPPEMP